LRISKPKSDNCQPWLFDADQYRLLRKANGDFNHGLARVVIGDFFENLTAKYFQGTRCKTDSRCDYCPDVALSNSYLEVKAAGRSKQTFIYEGRLEKDRKFSETHVLSYVVWSHSISVHDFENVSSLVESLRNSIECFFLVPVGAVLEVCSELRLTKLNSKYGNSDSNDLYGSGYRIPLSKLKDFRREFHREPIS